MGTSAVAGCSRRRRQSVMPSTSGSATSSTITSGVLLRYALHRLGGAAGLVHLDVDDLERRP